MDRRAPLLAPPFPVIFAAPSGAGKTSIARALRERRDDVVFSISATTRPPRRYERDGVDYFYHDEPGFRRMIAAGELLEWAEVHGNLYGTPGRNLEDAQANGQHLILDIDVQGSRQVREKVPDAISIFVLPPSGTELVRRLVGRGSEDGAVQRRRLIAARDEIAAAAEFDYVIVNHALDQAVLAVEAILAAESRCSRRLPGLNGFVRRLGEEVDEYLGSGPEGPGNETPGNEREGT
jgi:guanylate kinase